MIRILSRIYRSIAFLPVLLAIVFILFAIFILMVPIPLEDHYPKIGITDKKDINTILSFTIGGIFTLTIFSYTMVMNVLNRSINNYSPRLVPLVLSRREHQLILGFTSGTILYCLVLSLFVADSNISPFPSIAAPFAILFAMCCMILFIFFIHNVSQSIHVNYIIHASFCNTRDSLSGLLEDMKDFVTDLPDSGIWKDTISSGRCGYVKNIDYKKIAEIGSNENTNLILTSYLGSFVYEGEVILKSDQKLSKSVKSKLEEIIKIDFSEPKDVVEIGFKHMVEIAVKASSPALNDPGTSLSAMDYLTQLFLLRRKLKDFTGYQKDSSVFYFRNVPFQTLFENCFTELEHYMKEDPSLKKAISSSKNTICNDKTE